MLSLSKPEAGVEPDAGMACASWGPRIQVFCPASGCQLSAIWATRWLCHSLQTKKALEASVDVGGGGEKKKKLP